MSRATVHHQIHGYRKGHQLLSTSLVLNALDQDVVNRLSDLSGRLRPGELFDPYLTAYPLPSRAYYVVARTFQDLEASRSGCVLTRSLLIPMDAWVELENIDWLLAMLVEVQRGEKALPRDKPTAEGLPPKKVSDERVVDLVHALFLEDARPIVMFDAPEADLIATRLLVALWRTLRHSFSLCTLALGPRKLGGRHFDLVFAPLPMQSRFSGDDFRRIGVRSSLQNEPIHRLTASMAKRIFFSDQPSLAAPDVLNLLDKHELDDRGAVRLLLRLEELASRAKTTPTAVLGMLDIINARGGPSSQEWDYILPMVSAALNRVTVPSSSQGSWDFLFALTVKIEWDTAPVELVRKLDGAVHSLARAGPEKALAALNNIPTDARAPAIILKGISNGVAESPTFGALYDHLIHLESDLLLRLLDVGHRLGESLASAVNADPSHWVDVLAHMLEGEDADARRRVGRRILPFLDDSAATKTMPIILADVASTELVDLIFELAIRGKVRSQPFYAAFAEIVRNSGSVDDVRDAVMRDAVVSDARSKNVVALLQEIIEFTRSDVDWLLDLSDRRLAGRLLTVLLADADLTDIHSLLYTSTRTSRVVSVLRSALPSSGSQIARILTLDLLRDGAGLDVGFEIVSMLPAEEQQSLKKWLLQEELSAAPPGDDRLAHALAEFSVELTPDELVAAAAAASIAPHRVSENLEALNTGPAEIRRGVIGVVDELSRHLVERRWEMLDEAAYRVWAEMLADAATAKPARRIKAAATAFGFALRHARYPVSPLIVASFPTVYRELPKLKKLGLGKDLIPFSSSYWLRRKKPKDARRELIDTLVSTFLNSSWPAADLMIAAIEADVGEQVVNSIGKRFFGSLYLEKIGKDAKRLDDELCGRVLACLPDTT